MVTPTFERDLREAAGAATGGGLTTGAAGGAAGATRSTTALAAVLTADVTSANVTVLATPLPHQLHASHMPPTTSEAAAPRAAYSTHGGIGFFTAGGGVVGCSATWARRSESDFARDCASSAASPRAASRATSTSGFGRTNHSSDSPLGRSCDGVENPDGASSPSMTSVASSGGAECPSSIAPSSCIAETCGPPPGVKATLPSSDSRQPAREMVDDSPSATMPASRVTSTASCHAIGTRSCKRRATEILAICQLRMNPRSADAKFERFGKAQASSPDVAPNHRPSVAPNCTDPIVGIQTPRFEAS